MIRKNWKTTMVGAIIFFALVVTLAMVFTGHATLTEAGGFLSVFVSALSAVGFYNAMDAKRNDYDDQDNGSSGMLTIAILFVCLSLFACKPHQIVTERYDVSDSTSYTEQIIPRDTVIIKEPDTIKITVKVPCDDFDTVIVATDKGSIAISAKDGKLAGECICKELEFKVRVYDTIRKMYYGRLESHQKTITKWERFVPKLVKILAWIGAISIGLFILIIFLIIKSKLRLTWL